ncbi:MAG: DNA-directed RNA polymerase subunit alpha C-terminal domain-containing protein [Desulfosporosinus sp.]|nr:DNA-directed RNA polymerase subunit alpha C-terminal domain-containing protein [Desulfosporosinus sp.]
MVKERVVTQYVCELCQKAFTTREDAEDCEIRCHRFAESPRLGALNLSTRTFNLLYWSGLYTVRDIALMSEQDLKKIKGFGNWCLKEVKAKLAEYGIEDVRVNDRLPTDTNDLDRYKNKARRLKPQLDSNRLCLNDKLKEQLTLFVGSLDWPRQYKQYYHDEDSWENGFHNIVENRMMVVKNSFLVPLRFTSNLPSQSVKLL